MAFDALVTGHSDEANLRISLVHSKTGDVLALIRIQREGDRFEKNSKKA